MKLISIDLKSEFGVLKKPDTNIPIYLTFNMLHKPALLGIMGAILGLKGFQRKGELPEYYQLLKHVQIGLEPLNTEKGNFQKTIIKYNNTTGMASKEQGGNLIIAEQTLISPAFRCYFLLDTQDQLLNQLDKNLEKGYAEYVPYLGKNECALWWDNYQVFDYQDFKPTKPFKINSLFIKDAPIAAHKYAEPYSPLVTSSGGNTFSYFERLPIGYNDQLFQYEYANFAFSDWSFKENYPTQNRLLKTQNNEIIQVF